MEREAHSLTLFPGSTYFPSYKMYPLLCGGGGGGNVKCTWIYVWRVFFFSMKECTRRWNVHIHTCVVYYTGILVATTTSPPSVVPCSLSFCCSIKRLTEKINVEKNMQAPACIFPHPPKESSQREEETKFTEIHIVQNSILNVREGEESEKNAMLSDYRLPPLCLN